MPTQWHFWPAQHGPDYDAWRVSRLIQLSAELPVTDVAVDSFTELDTDYWTDAASAPSVRRVLNHARLILAVDPRHPIILRPDGRLMDGMHRLCRAILEERPTIPAVRFPAVPEPDVRNCRFEDLLAPATPETHGA